MLTANFRCKIYRDDNPALFTHHTVFHHVSYSIFFLGTAVAVDRISILQKNGNFYDGSSFRILFGLFPQKRRWKQFK